jgi:tetratricopeptide (TPR) repeat protein
MRRLSLLFIFILPGSWLCAKELPHNQAPERLGTVSFSTSCAPTIQKDFARGIALLHSFAYATAQSEFRSVAERDPHCAMAHWGIAMTYFHELWEPPVSEANFPLGQQEIKQAKQIGAPTDRERRYINALASIYQDASIPYRTRVLNYERAMGEVAAADRNDIEGQVFYALSLLATALPTDKTHANQKRALEVLQPLYKKYPEHPGIAHYMIHACDNAELASRGLAPARVYSRIAPSVPHALHMPSHIFTRLGLWKDSIDSNLAASAAARKEGDLGEELHAMDYLVYAYLQEKRDDEAEKVIEQLKGMNNLNESDFKTGYAFTAMPIRYAVERRQWAEAARIVPPAEAPPHVKAIALWARAVGLARTGRPKEATAEINGLRKAEQQLRAAGKEYWANQVAIQTQEAMAWSAQAEGKPDEALALMRKASDKEDAVEKLPVTPGPIIPAREQLGDLLLEQKQPKLAAKEFETALKNAPGRRGALGGLARVNELSTAKK